MLMSKGLRIERKGMFFDRIRLYMDLFCSNVRELYNIKFECRVFGW